MRHSIGTFTIALCLVLGGCAEFNKLFKVDAGISTGSSNNKRTAAAGPRTVEETHAHYSNQHVTPSLCRVELQYGLERMDTASHRTPGEDTVAAIAAQIDEGARRLRDANICKEYCAQTEYSAKECAHAQLTSQLKSGLADLDALHAAHVASVPVFESGQAMLNRIETDIEATDEQLQAAWTTQSEAVEALRALHPSAPLGVLGTQLTDAQKLLANADYRRANGAANRDYTSMANSAVTTRFEGFSKDDLYRLDRVGEAFEAASEDMLFVWVGGARATGKNKTFPRHLSIGHRPVPNSAMRSLDSDSKGAGQTAWYDPVSSKMGLGTRGKPTPPKGMPGLVWHQGKDTLMFVTVDGDVFRVSIAGDRPDYVATFETWGGEKPSKPLRNTGLTADEIESLEKNGLLDAGTTEALLDSAREANVCADEFWASHDRDFDAIAKKDLRPSTREARYDALRNSLRKKLPKACKAHVAAHKALAEELLAPWHDARRALYDRATAALARLR